MGAPLALVYGLAVTGESTVRALLRRGYEVIVADDVVTPERREAAVGLGVDLIATEREGADASEIAELVKRCALVSPSPGVPETHEVIIAAQRAGVEVVSEIELAYRWEQERPGGPRPILAITGTDGKTTTTLMTVAMLRAAGLSTIDAGNTETPLVDAIEDDHDAFVVEATSFRLAWTPTFRAEAAVWLNLAPDHLNWHESMQTYGDAKARIWINQRPTDVAIGFAQDAEVMARLSDVTGRTRTFGAGGDYRAEAGELVGPDGPICSIDAMRRSLPHDITNAAAASALVLESGLADTAAIQRALASFIGPPHRLEHVGQWNGVDWYNDSKATTPHAAAVAIRAFDDIVLIAGGKDKYVDLAEMAVDRDPVRAVIAIGQTRDAVVAAFKGVEVVESTEFLPAAVERACELARPGSTVLLSPGCASLDQYRSFEARGDHFRELVVAVNAALSTPTDQQPAGAD